MAETQLNPLVLFVKDKENVVAKFTTTKVAPRGGGLAAHIAEQRKALGVLPVAATSTTAPDPGCVKGASLSLQSCEDTGSTTIGTTPGNEENETKKQKDDHENAVSAPIDEWVSSVIPVAELAHAEHVKRMDEAAAVRWPSLSPAPVSRPGTGGAVTDSVSPVPFAPLPGAATAARNNKEDANSQGVAETPGRAKSCSFASPLADETVYSVASTSSRSPEQKGQQGVANPNKGAVVVRSQSKSLVSSKWFRASVMVLALAAVGITFFPATLKSTLTTTTSSHHTNSKTPAPWTVAKQQLTIHSHKCPQGKPSFLHVLLKNMKVPRSLTQMMFVTTPTTGPFFNFDTMTVLATQIVQSPIFVVLLAAAAFTVVMLRREKELRAQLTKANYTIFLRTGHDEKHTHDKGVYKSLYEEEKAVAHDLKLQVQEMKDELMFLRAESTKYAKQMLSTLCQKVVHLGKAAMLVDETAVKCSIGFPSFGALVVLNWGCTPIAPELDSRKDQRHNEGPRRNKNHQQRQPQSVKQLSHQPTELWHHAFSFPITLRTQNGKVLGVAQLSKIHEYPTERGSFMHVLQVTVKVDKNFPKINLRGHRVSFSHVSPQSGKPENLGCLYFDGHHNSESVRINLKECGRTACSIFAALVENL